MLCCKGLFSTMFFFGGKDLYTIQKYIHTKPPWFESLRNYFKIQNDFILPINRNGKLVEFGDPLILLFIQQKLL